MIPAKRRELVAFHSTAVCVAGRQPLQPLLSSHGDLATGPVPDKGNGPPVPGNPILRFQTDEGLAGTAGHAVSRKRVQRLMRIMGLRVIYRRPRTSQPVPERRVYPYLLRDLAITRANQVWAAAITYLPMARGFLYLVAIMDWHSRYVVAWRLS